MATRQKAGAAKWSGATASSPSITARHRSAGVRMRSAFGLVAGGLPLRHAAVELEHLREAALDQLRGDRLRERATATVAVDDEVLLLRQGGHLAGELGHRDVHRRRDMAGRVLARLAGVDQDVAGILRLDPRAHGGELDP